MKETDIRMGVFTLAVQTHKRVPNAYGGFSSRPDKTVAVKVRVEVNMEGLAMTLGRSAYFNKGKLSREAGGCVVVRVLEETTSEQHPVEVGLGVTQP